MLGSLTQSPFGRQQGGKGYGLLCWAPVYLEHAVEESCQPSRAWRKQALSSTA